MDEFDTNKIYSQPMRVAVAKSTGMDNSDEVMMSEINLERWKDKNNRQRNGTDLFQEL